MKILFYFALAMIIQNSYGQKIKTVKDTKAIQEFYLYSEGSAIPTDTLFIVNQFKENSFYLTDSSIFHVGKIRTASWPLIYFIREFRIKDGMFYTYGSTRYRIKSCDRSDYLAIQNIQCKFSSKGFDFRYITHNKKHKIHLPMHLLSIEKIKCLLPECW